MFRSTIEALNVLQHNRGIKRSAVQSRLKRSEFRSNCSDFFPTPLRVEINGSPKLNSDIASLNPPRVGKLMILTSFCDQNLVTFVSIVTVSKS